MKRDICWAVFGFVLSSYVCVGFNSNLFLSSFSFFLLGFSYRLSFLAWRPVECSSWCLLILVLILACLFPADRI